MASCFDCNVVAGATQPSQQRLVMSINYGTQGWRFYCRNHWTVSSTFATVPLMCNTQGKTRCSYCKRVTDTAICKPCHVSELARSSLTTRTDRIKCFIVVGTGIGAAAVCAVVTAPHDVHSIHTMWTSVVSTGAFIVTATGLSRLIGVR
jgi:hypothetical protein